MLELITASGTVSIQDMGNDYALTHKYNGVDMLHFDISLEDPVFPMLELEALVYESTENQTYLIRGIDAGEHQAAVDCELNLDDWKQDIFLKYSNNTASLPATLAPLLPNGWTLSWESQILGMAELTTEGGTPLDIFLAAQDKFDCAMRFDTAEKICRIYDPHQSPLGYTVLAEGASLLCRPQYVGKSSGLATRLYPIGANGLTIASVNGGKDYVEDHSFTDKVICEIWQDDRYEIPSNLMAAAKKKLKKLAVPSISWELSLADLYRLDPVKWPEHRVELFWQVQFQYGNRQISALCVQEEIHPHCPEHDTVYIGAVPASAMSGLSSLTEEVQNPNSAFNMVRAAAVDNATKKIVGSTGGHVVLVLDANGKPEEICILTDTEDISTAQSLWRWNESGLGHSDTGYNGEYVTAITKDGAIGADRITAGQLNANIVKAGTLSDYHGKNYWNMETGEFSLSSAVTVGGNTVDGIASEAADSAVHTYDSSLNQQAVFNKLTGGGQTQGIYLQGGRLYLNASYMQTGQLNANNVDLTGRFAVYNGDTKGGYIGFMAGATDTAATDGIGVCDPSGSCYAIATTEGVRLQAGNTSIYAVKNGDVHVTGNLHVTGQVHAENI